MPATRLLRVLSIAEALGYGPQSAFEIIDAALASLPEHHTKEALFSSLSPSSTPTQLLAIYLLLPDKPPLPCSAVLLPAALRLLQSISSTDLPIRLTLVLITTILELESNQRVVGQATVKIPACEVDVARIAEQASKWPAGVVPKALTEARALAERVPHNKTCSSEKREEWQRAWCLSNSSVVWTGVRLLVRLFLAGIPKGAQLPAELAARLGSDAAEAALPSLQIAALNTAIALLRIARQRDVQHAAWLALQLYEAAAVPALLKAILTSYALDSPSPVATAAPHISLSLRLLHRVGDPFPSAFRLLARLRGPVVLRRVIESHAHGVERHLALRLHCRLLPYLGRKWPRTATNASIVTLFYMELPPRLFSPLSVSAEPEEEGNAVTALSDMEEKANCNRLRLYATQLFARYGRVLAAFESDASAADGDLEREAEEWVQSPESSALRAIYEEVR